MIAKKNPSLLWRYLAVLGVFVVICLVYVIRLAGYQLFGENTDVRREYEVKSFSYNVTIPALRGDICDRDGKIIATTKKAYSLAFDYWSMPADKQAANRSILIALEAVKELGLETTEDYFPFMGEYPNLAYTPEALREGEKLHTRLLRVIKRRNFDADMSAEDMVKWYCKKFGMLDGEGEPRYSNEEMTALLRVRYNMDATDFGAYAQYVLAENVSLDTVAYVEEKNAAGVVFPQSTEREYNYPGYLSHILGSVGDITAETLEYYMELGYPMGATVGVSGIEALFEEYLHGTDGVMTVVEDEAGNVIDRFVAVEPVPGKDVWLTIDIDLQVAAEDKLAEFVEKYSENESAGGAVVAIDPATSGVLVLASYPTYDLTQYNELYNSLAADPAVPLLNRSLNGVYTPGSTFKLGMAAAALEEHKITASEDVYCSGIYRLGSYGMKCWVHPDAHGYQNVVEAIAHSCNVFFGEMGMRLGITTMNRYCKLYGLGEPTGIELTEATGNLAGEANRTAQSGALWYDGDTLQAAIGQSDNAFTPLQICNYVTTLLRGGERNSVHILDSVRAYYTDELLVSYEGTQYGKSFLSPRTLETVKTGMRTMIEESATISSYMRDVPVTVGGKTGTAEVGTENDNGLFVCAAPYNDPDIVISCVIEGANTGLRSAGVAAAVLEEFYGVNDKE